MLLSGFRILSTLYFILLKKEIDQLFLNDQFYFVALIGSIEAKQMYLFQNNLPGIKMFEIQTFRLRGASTKVGGTCKIGQVFISNVLETIK